jgi:diazepam-binding inhibitor (GABA receptor modulating acyl-CoA-binding protein)
MTVSIEQFEKVAALVADKSTPAARPSTRTEKLRLYGLYKRGTVGRLSPPFTEDDVDIDSRPERPGIFNIDGRMKWDAWKEEDKLATRDEAREKYVELARELVGKPVDDLLQG